MTRGRHEVEDLVSLAGRTALISGAASGIGRRTAELLAAAGAEVTLLDIEKDAGEAAAARIRESGGKAGFRYCDVTRDEECRCAVADVFDKQGRIDILFNNAGTAVRKTTIELEEREWDRALDVTLKSIFLLSRHVIPHMIRAGGGSIINTGSGWALKGGEAAVSYCAAKGGVLNMTRAMALDHGRHNIRVNCVCPGDVDTPMLRDECRQLGEDMTDFLREAAARPLARVGTPLDVAKAVLFFASDLSPWVTGSFLVVDGGGIA